MIYEYLGNDGIINWEMMGCEDNKERNVRAVGMVVEIRTRLYRIPGRSFAA
jgi:hypothetical protein